MKQVFTIVFLLINTFTIAQTPVAFYPFNGNGIALNGNAENRLSLYKRNDNATTTWNAQSVVLDNTANTLTTSTQNGEIIIGVNTPLQETITLRSGNGSIGQADSKVKMLVGPADTHFSNLFTNTDFTAARNGSAALITQNNGAWIASLPADANAKWINDVGNPNAGSTCLYAIDFIVNGNVTNADITFNYAIDNVLGGNLNQGIYINGQALSGNTANIGGFGGQSTIVRNDIASMLQQGVNTLYVNATDQGGPGALIFSATINMIYNNNNPGVISASQSSCVAAIPAPLIGTTAFNTSTGVSFQWQDSIVNGVWTNIPNATNGDTYAPPLLSSSKYYRRLATLSNTTLASNEILLDFRSAIDPSIFPINSWYVYAYNTANISLLGADYRGFYSVNGLNQDTRNHWNELLSPSVASGYQGCPVNNDNFTFVLKRKGVSSGEYLLNIPTHDDGIRVLVNGVQKFEHLSCCDAHKNISLGNLDDSSEIEIRCTELTSPANIVLSFMKVTRLSDTLNGCSNITLNGKTFSSSTIVIDTIRNAQGFDSIYTTTNIIIDAFATTTNTVNFSGCNTVNFGGTVFTSSIIIRDTIRTSEGCDSIINVKNIVVTPISLTTITNNITACNSVVFRGSTFTTNAIIRDTIKSNQGCDSVITINNILPQIATNLTNNISGVHTVTFKGIVFTNDAVVKDTIKSTIGCDSIITVTSITVIKVADLLVTDITASQSNITPKNKINIAWTIKNIGKANSGDGWQERISVENGNGESVYLGTAYFTNTLDSAATVTRQIEFTVPEIVTLNDSALLKIVVVPNANTTEPVVLQANNTAYAADSIFVNKQLFIKPSTVVIEETDANFYSGYLFRSGSRKNTETFGLKSNDTSRLQILDTSITIPTGLSGTNFRYKVKDNNILDTKDEVVITASGNINYLQTNDTIHIIDDELATLTMSVSKDSISNGDSLQLTIARQIINNTALNVSLISSTDDRFNFPNTVTIPANQNSVTVSVVTKNNDLPALAESVSFSASATRYHTTTKNVVIRANNIPVVTLDILPASFSENAGTQAAIAKIKRQGNTNFPVTFTIADNANGDIFYTLNTITLNKGQSEAQFFIGVNDNNLVDGARQVNVSASVFIASCGCSVNASNQIAAGFVTKQITILDNDGPSLNVSLSETNLPEGKTNASVLTITRNTTTTLPLTISIASDRDSNLVYAKTVVIPIGSSSIDVPITAPSNSIAEGDKIVTFQITAIGFAGNSTWGIITDRSLPDATVILMPLGFGSAYSKSTITIKSIIANQGVVNLPIGTNISFYLTTQNQANDNGVLIHSITTTKIISPNLQDTITSTFLLPDKLGEYKIFAKTNPNQTISELSFLNNFSNTQPLKLLPNYRFINIATNKSVYLNGDSVTITGSAQAFANNISIANVPVEVYYINNQFRESFSATTDINGNFSTKFLPLSGQLGYFSAGACYPNLGLIAEQTNFNVLGLKLASNDFIKWELNVNDTLRGQIEIINPSKNLPLTHLSTSINSFSNNRWNLKFDSIPNIAADSSVVVNYYITSNLPTVFNNYEQIHFSFNSIEGASLSATGYFYCRALQANLQSSIATLQTTMIKGSTKNVAFTLRNIGAGATGNITISLPNVPWMTLQTPITLPSLNRGDSQIIVIQLSPENSMPANVPVSGTIGINCQNGSGILLPFSVTPVSTSKGSLAVAVEDEFTYFSSGSPLVKGASVKLTNIYTNATIVDGFSDSTGQFKVDSIADGFYKLTVSAFKHDSYTNNILINAGQTTSIRAFLSIQAVSYTWTVVPTNVKDTYNIVSTLTFTTNVPVPVVILTMPDSIPKLLGNDIFTFKAVMTNKGLITAKDVQFILPNDDEYEFIYNYAPTDILAQQSIQVPVLVRRKSTASKASSPSNPKCADFAINIYGWECGANNKTQRIEKTITFSGRNCSGQAIITPIVGGGIGGLNLPSNGLGIGGGIVIPPIPYVRMDSSCNPCIDAIGGAVAGCIPGVPLLGAILSCASSAFDLKITAKEVVTCALNFAGDAAFVAGCTIGAIDAFCTCKPGGFCDDLNKFNSGDVGGNPFISIGTAAKNNIFNPSSLLESNMNNLKDAFVGMRSLEFWLAEIFNGIEKKHSSVDFYTKVQPFISDTIKIQDSSKTRIKIQMLNQDVTSANIDSFVNRWNNTVDAWKTGFFSPNSSHPNIIDSFRLHYYDSLYKISYNKAISKGFANVKAMQDTALQNIKNATSKKSSSVCAAVTIQFSQTVTMTRQAFRGTFTLFNGNTTDSVKNFQLNIVIKDDQGNIVGSQKINQSTESISKLGAINGTGSLAPNDTGSATLLFIPTKYAAPITPKLYSFGGSLSYLDPFTGNTITRTLFPVPITVNPSPDLNLDYFIQRDILGDDPLTVPIEPSKPAEFSLIINNTGYGDATEVQFTTEEPKIIDNQKGLLLNMNMVGSSLNGAPTSIGFSNLNFGTINARSTMYGQWFFNSSLLGQFVNYDVNVTHVSSYNNPDLSLISAANIHQLVHTINVPSNDSANPIAFLSTDVPNIGNNPDAIYVTNGIKHNSFVAQNASVTVINDSTLRLTVTPLIRGWNYKSVANPFAANKTLKNVINENNKANVSLRNVWLTDRTLLEGQDPIYENRIHIANDVQDSIQSYILTFNAEPNIRLAVDAITGVPDTVATIPIHKVTVHFNKAINISSFTNDDVVIRCQGVVLNTNSIIINTINDSTFELGITAITNSNGYYSLTVQTNAITDKEGFNGIVGFVSGWNQFADNLQIIALANPAVGGIINPSFAQQPFGSNIQLTAHQSIAYKFISWTIDNANVSFDSILNHLVTSSKSITANFEKKKCILNVVTDDVKGNTSGNSSGVYEFGNIISASVSANTGYLFLGWKLNGILVSTNPSFSFSINKDVTLEPTFKTKVNPILQWDNPLVLTCSNSLRTALNATADVSGSFVYNPPIGTVLNNNSSYTLYVTFTPTDTFTFNVVLDSVFVSTNYIQVVTTSNNIHSCSSVLFNGITYNSSVLVSDTLRNVQGCDSVIINTSIVIEPITATIFNNTLIGCNSVLFKGTLFTNPTTVRDTLRSVQGCDCIITNTSIVIEPITATIFNNTIIGCNSVLFKGTLFTNSTTLRDTLRSIQGCDSVITNTSIAITPITATIINNTLIGCNSVLFKGTLFTNSTTVRDTLRSVHGCDSVITNTSIAITPITATIINNTLIGCNSVLFKGTLFTNSTTVRDTLRSVQGCDSVITNTSIVITSINVVIFSDTIRGCNSAFFNGNVFSSSAYIYDTLKNSGGCDSIIKITIIIVSVPAIPSITISANKTNVCNIDTVLFNSNILNGGTNPILQWKKNGVNAGNSSTISFLPNTLTTGDVITCVLTSNNTCQTNPAATSNAITMTVKQSPLVAQISNGISAITTASLCALNSTYNYYNATGYGVWTSSNPSVASVSSASQKGVVTANSNGTTTLNYTVTASNGCVSSSSIVLTVAQQATPIAISGTNNICVGATTDLSSTAPVGTTGVWSSSNDRGIISVGGVYTAKNAGTGEARYTVTNASGCKAFASYAITVNPTPVVPTITYAPGTPNPQLGAPTGGFCVGKKFRVVATPNVPAGFWTATGAASFAGYDTVKINAVGAGSIKYTYNSAAGCVNSRTMSATGYTCASRGVNTVDGQLSTIDGFTMYPNPAKGYINLNVETLIGAGSIVVTDLYGKTVKTQNLSIGTNTIDIAKLRKGIYFVSTIANEGKTTKKLVVE